jgi:Uma2 family endonuclease
MTSLIITPETIDLPPGSSVTLQYQTWEDYENLLNVRQDKAGVRIRYSATRQEIYIMAPLPGHGNRVDTLSDLVKALLRYQGRDWQSFDPITLKRLKQAGLEPDACFYIQNREAILGKDRIDLAIDPPPDLAIEVDLSSKTDITDYLPIAIPEVWIYRRNELLIYCLENQSYQDGTTSGTFPDFDVKSKLPQYVERAWSLGSSIALREFEQAFTQI